MYIRCITQAIAIVKFAVSDEYGKDSKHSLCIVFPGHHIENCSQK